MRRLLFGAVAACLVLAGAEALTPKASAEVAPCVVSDTLVNSCRPWLGASAGRYPNVGTGFRAQIEAHEKRIGRSLDVVHNYHPAGDLPLNADELYFVNRPDTLVFLNWKPAVVWASAAGGDETVNSQIDQVADRFRAVSPHKVFLTLYHEPENDVSAGNCTANATAAASGSPSDYRNMWRNVHDRFAARGVDNVVWVMDYMNYPPWDCLVDQLYPGNDLVDWVMFNAYGDRLHPDYAANVSHFYQLLTANSDVGHDYLSKPWGIVEWNYQNATEAAAVSYYDQAKAALDAHRFPRLKAYLTFDNIGPEGNENRVNYVSGVLSAVTQAHYTAFAGDPVLVGDGVALPDITAPSAFVRAPVGNTTVQGTVDVAADVSDETGVTSVRLRVDGADGAVDAVEPFAPAVLHWDSTAVANGPHQLSVQATDAAGNTATSQAVTVVVGNPDVRPPSVPDGLGAVAVSDSAVDVSWNAATDDVGVAGYRVYRDGSLLATLSEVTAYRDTGLTGSTAYSYRVLAFDAAGNESAPTDEVGVTMPGPVDTAPPTTPVGPTATAVGSSRIDVSWTASTDDVAVTGYRVYRNGVLVATLGPVIAYSDTGLVDGAAYSYRVAAFDAAGNAGPSSASVSATTPDVTAPSAPGGLRGTSASYTSIGLAWTAATDNVGVAGYRIIRNGVQVGTAAGPSYTDTGLLQGASYSYAVTAVDARGNASTASPAVVLTARADDLAPAVPAGVRAAVTQSYLVTVSWGAAADSGGSGLAGYRVYRSDKGTSPLATVGAGTPSYRDTLVAAGTKYTYRVLAFDARGNSSAQSAGVTATTARATESVAPTRPTNLRPTTVTSSSIRLAWTASTDRSGVKGYHVYRDNTYVGDASTAAFTDGGLAAGSVHQYRVAAFDSSANVSPSSATLTATTSPALARAL